MENSKILHVGNFKCSRCSAKRLTVLQVESVIEVPAQAIDAALNPQWHRPPEPVEGGGVHKGLAAPMPSGLVRLRRKAFEITDTELRLMASAAIIGASNQPVNGNSTPAASGTPSAL